MNIEARIDQIRERVDQLKASGDGHEDLVFLLGQYDELFFAAGSLITTMAGLADLAQREAEVLRLRVSELEAIIGDREKQTAVRELIRMGRG